MFKTYWTLGAGEAEQALKIRAEAPGELGREDELDAISAHLVVELDGEPIACSRMSPYNGAVKIDKAFVKPDHRKKGFGDLLVRVSLDKARRMGVEKIYVDAGGKHREYYKSFGFEDDGELMSVAPEHIDWHPSCGEHYTNHH